MHFHTAFTPGVAACPSGWPCMRSYEVMPYATTYTCYAVTPPTHTPPHTTLHTCCGSAPLCLTLRSSPPTFPHTPSHLLRQHALQAGHEVVRALLLQFRKNSSTQAKSVIMKQCTVCTGHVCTLLLQCSNNSSSTTTSGWRSATPHLVGGQQHHIWSEVQRYNHHNQHNHCIRHNLHDHLLCINTLTAVSHKR